MSAASTPSRPPAQQLDEKRKTQSKATDRVCALECASWLPTILPDIPTPAADASSDDKYEFFFNSLTSGVILCRLVAAATKGEVAPKYKDAKAGSFIARDNVTNALSALRSPPLSLRPEVVCETDDLVDRKNERAFVNMLLIFSKICMIKYGTEAPAMVKFELEIDEEHAEHGATEGADGEKKAAPLTTDTGAGKDAVEENVEEEHAWVPPPTPKKKTSTVTNDSPAPAATIITTTPPPAAAAAAPAAAPAPAAAASAPAAEAASSSLAAPSGSGSRSRTPSSSTPGHSHQLSQGGAAHPPSEIDLAIAEVLDDHDWLWLSVKKIQILNKQKRKAAARGGKGEYKFGSVGGKVAVRVVQGEAMVREKNEWIDLVTYLKEKIVPHEKH